MATNRTYNHELGNLLSGNPSTRLHFTVPTKVVTSEVVSHQQNTQALKVKGLQHGLLNNVWFVQSHLYLGDLPLMPPRTSMRKSEAIPTSAVNRTFISVHSISQLLLEMDWRGDDPDDSDSDESSYQCTDSRNNAIGFIEGEEDTDVRAVRALRVACMVLPCLRDLSLRTRRTAVAEDLVYSDVREVLCRISAPAALALSSARSLKRFTLRLTKIGEDDYDGVLDAPQETYRELIFDIGAMPATGRLSTMERLLKSSIGPLCELFHEQTGNPWSGLRNRVPTIDQVLANYAYLTCVETIEHATISALRYLQMPEMEPSGIRHDFESATREALAWDEKCRSVWGEWREVRSSETKCNIKAAAKWHVYYGRDGMLYSSDEEMDSSSEWSDEGSESEWFEGNGEDLDDGDDGTGDRDVDAAFAEHVV